MQAYFRVATYTEELACRDLLSREILEQAERLGVELAVSTKTTPPAASGGRGTLGPSTAEAPRSRTRGSPAARAQPPRRPRAPGQTRLAVDVAP